MREAWIRAKYEKKMFEAGDEKGDDIGCSVMPEPSREGYMWKESGAAEGKFQKRWFILYGNRLSYYKDSGVRISFEFPLLLVTRLANIVIGLLNDMHILCFFRMPKQPSSLTSAGVR